MKFPARILLVFVSLLLVIAFSCNTKNDDVPKGGVDPTDTIEPKDSMLDTVTFTVIGDVPYNSEQRDGLISMIQTHNTKAQSEFAMMAAQIAAIRKLRGK